jgi:hypothetical protein
MIFDVVRSSDRFSGYSLPLVQLDETGPAYIALLPHPATSRTPSIWVDRGVSPVMGKEAQILPF